LNPSHKEQVSIPVIGNGHNPNTSQPNPYMKNKIILMFVAFGIYSVTSCLPLAAGAAVGYVAHKDGYRVENPISKR
jgi:hypothetical protein